MLCLRFFYKRDHVLTMKESVENNYIKDGAEKGIPSYIKALWGKGTELIGGNEKGRGYFCDYRKRAIKDL